MWQVNVRDYGAVGDGSTDDYSHIMNALGALTAASPYGGICVFPPGVYAVGTSIGISAPGLTLRGSNRNDCIIKGTMTTGSVIAINSTAGVVIRDLQITTTRGITPTGILVDSSTGWNGLSIFDGIYVAEFDVGIEFRNAANWTLRDSLVVNSSVAGLVIRNTHGYDTGDSVVEGCFFTSESTVSTTSIAIPYESSGGLKFIGNKILYHQYGIDLAVENGANTANLVMTGNSIENQFDTGVRLRTLVSGGTGTFRNIVITGNQFTLDTDLGGRCIQIYPWAGRGTSAHIKNVVITGNTFSVGGDNGTGVDAQYGYGVNIVGNTFEGGGSSTVGIRTTGNSDASQSQNLFRGLTTNTI